MESSRAETVAFRLNGEMVVEVRLLADTGSGLRWEWTIELLAERG